VAVALVASLGLYLLTRQLQGMLPLPAEDAQLLVEWSPLPYAFSYCLGICAYKIRKPRGDAAIAAVLAAAALFALWPVDLMDRYVFVSFATFALVSMGSGRSAICRVLFTNKAVLFLGAISYGLYLAHFPLKMMMGLEGRHDVLAFLLIVAAATVASTITYYAVERPVRRLAGRWPALVRA
jgi:peptidoglycan/LPS O-acetylase OafA/YrhL